MRSSYSSSRLLWGFVFVALFMVFGGTATAQVRYDSAAYKVLVDTDSLDTIPVGTNITLQNWQKYKHFMPIAMQVLFGGQYRYKIGPEPFYTMAVGPHSSFPLPKKYRDDTEKYKDQAKLVQVSSGGYTVDGYIAGMPFPTLRNLTQRRKWPTTDASAIIRSSSTTLTSPTTLIG